jgi:hypothetical protein
MEGIKEAVSGWGSKVQLDGAISRFVSSDSALLLDPFPFLNREAARRVLDHIFPEYPADLGGI